MFVGDKMATIGALKTTPEELWDAWNELNNYAIATRNDDLYNKLVEINYILEHIPGMIA